MEAIDIVARGGVFLPSSCLSSQGWMVPEPCMVSPSGVTFTGREYAVLGSLRQGKSNKCIAYDLKMSESTVKVHVRNIMKKLRARNRTEVAFLTQTMFNGFQSRQDDILYSPREHGAIRNNSRGVQVRR
jgi:DNA-binding NarL/FixJ family response regulator